MSLSNGEIGMARVFLLRACLGKIPKGDLIGGGPPHRKEQSDPLRPDSSGGVKAMASVRMGQAFLHQAPGSGDVESRRVWQTRPSQVLESGRRIMVVTSPARRCVQTGAERYVEPGLADWTEEVNIDRGGTPCYWPTLSSGPVWDRPPAEETWDMAVERYQVTCEGGEAQIALTELGVSRADGLQHDCLAWRERFAFVAARGEKLFLSPQCSHVTARPFQMDPDLGDIMVLQLDEAPLTLVKSRRARHLLLFLHDAQGHLLHLASGLLLSLKDEQLVLSSRPGIYWHLNHSGELVANDGHPLVLGPEGLGLQLDAERGASLPAVHLELVPL
ncbi:Transcription factor tau 55 kDa subunit [Durusdinium trenchii]|uniref:Transcription factor tau 55 kDa subunit n=1 Tax=Durusdinium trenchii TaxID=1381693 RepID=A0ABP0MC76_9DINO